MHSLGRTGLNCECAAPWLGRASPVYLGAGASWAGSAQQLGHVCPVCSEAGDGRALVPDSGPDTAWPPSRCGLEEHWRSGLRTPAIEGNLGILEWEPRSVWKVDLGFKFRWELTSIHLVHLGTGVNVVLKALQNTNSGSAMSPPRASPY